MRIIFLLLTFGLLSIGTIFSQATLSVAGFSKFQKSLHIGDPIANKEMSIGVVSNGSSSLLEFNSAAGTSGFFLNGISNTVSLGTLTQDKITVITDNTARMILTNNGDFGIGTPGPQTSLHVRSDGDIGIPTQVMVLESATSNIPVLKFDEGNNLGMSIQYDGTGSGDNNKLHILTTTNQELATFTNGGRLGINETAPQEVLEVEGNITVETKNSVLFYESGTVQAEMNYDGTHLTLENSGFVGDVRLEGRTNTEIKGGGDILLDGGAGILFFTDVSTKGRLNADGKFGINATNPQGMFHVRAFSNTDDALRFENDNNTINWSFRVKNDNLELHFNGVPIGIYSGSNGNYAALSDRRFKEDIQQLDAGTLHKLRQLKPSTYYYKADNKKEKKSIGLIAQDAEKLFPELVIAPEFDDDYYSLDYSKLAVLAVHAIQEQQQEIDALEREIEKKLALKASIEKNKKTAEFLKSKIEVLTK